ATHRLRMPPPSSNPTTAARRSSSPSVSGGSAGSQVCPVSFTAALRVVRAAPETKPGPEPDCRPHAIVFPVHESTSPPRPLPRRLNALLIASLAVVRSKPNPPVSRPHPIARPLVRDARILEGLQALGAVPAK